MIDRREGEELGLWKSDILHEYTAAATGRKGNLEIVVFDVLVLTRPKILFFFRSSLNSDVTELQHISMKGTKVSKEISNNTNHYM